MATCKTCNGAKKEVCPVCNASTRDPRNQNAKCGNCNGVGTKVCGWCKGSGKE